MIAYLFSLLVMLAVGVLATRFILRQSYLPLPLIVCLGSITGIGISSCSYFLFLLLFTAHAQTAWWISELSLMALLCAGLFFSPSKGYFKLNFRSAGNLLTIACLIVGLIVIGSFWLTVYLQPHSNWDALMIWNVRARFLERDPFGIANTFSPLIFWSHPDYPLLLPAIVSFGLLLTGESQFAPASIAFLFTMLAPLLLITSLSYLKTPRHGLLAGLILFTTPFWTACGASMLADVPIACYFLGTMVCFSLYDKDKNPNFLIMTGVFASMSAWTKNEGQFFILCVIAASVIAARNVKIGRRALLSVFTGGIPVLLLLFWFKMTLAPQNDLIAGQGASSTTQRLLNPTRYLIVAQYFAVYLVTFGAWLISPVPLLALLSPILRVRLDDVTSIRAACTVVLMILGYAVIYITTPTDLAQHLSTSVDRLFLQLWPMGIFAIGMSLPIEEVEQKVLPDSAMPEPNASL